MTLSALGKVFPKRLTVSGRDTSELDSRTIKALIALLFLVQLPHVLHLPLWVTLLGSGIVSLRLCALRFPEKRVLMQLLSPLAITGIAIAAAIIIRLQYGYFLGRDPSVAFLFLLVAAKSAELKRPNDATLLLCLAAFLLLTQYFYSQSILSAIVTLPAVVALGHALAILRDPKNPTSSKSQLKLIGKLLLQGVPLAALLFVVFPRLPGPLWSLPEDAMATTGLSDTMNPGSIASLIQSPTVAFRVDFDEAPPPNAMRYWRGPVLTNFDGQQWSKGQRAIEVPVQNQRSANGETNLSDAVSYTVTLQPHKQRWLFALDNPVSLPETGLIENENSSTTTTNRSVTDRSQNTAGRLLADGQLVSDDPVLQVLRYRQRSSLSDRLVPLTRPSTDTLQLAGKNRRTMAFARELRADVGSDAEYAQKVLKHFNENPYHYTLKPQLLGDSPVDEFMFQTRSGFCEHYAAAFVVMMRSVGIHSRIVTGYQGGEINEDYMIVRQSDAHAWTEAYIDGAWQRYDPTAAVAPSRVERGVASALPEGDTLPRMARLDGGWLKDMQLRWDSMNHQWQRLVVDFDNDSQLGLLKKFGLPTPKLWQIAAGVMFAAALWCFAVLGLPTLANAKLSATERSWQRLCRMLEQRGFTRGNAETPGDFLQRVAKAEPTQATRLHQLENAFTELRFTAQSDLQNKMTLKTINRELQSLKVALFKARFSLAR